MVSVANIKVIASLFNHPDSGSLCQHHWPTRSDWKSLIKTGLFLFDVLKGFVVAYVYMYVSVSLRVPYVCEYPQSPEGIGSLGTDACCSFW